MEVLMIRRHAAVFTIVQNEPIFLPLWLRYYREHFHMDDIFVLDHDCTCQTTIYPAQNVNRVPVHNGASFDHSWLLATVTAFQKFLFQSYEQVLFAEVDEIVLADPLVHGPAGLK